MEKYEISDELSILINKLNGPKIEEDEYSGEEGINNILPYSDIENNKENKVILDRSNSMIFKIISHNFKNGFRKFQVFHYYYSKYLAIDIKYFNSFEKYKDLIGYFKRIWENSEFKANIEIDYSFAISNWQEIFSKYFHESKNYHIKNHPFKHIILKEQFGGKYCKLGLDPPVKKEEVKLNLNSKNFKKGKQLLRRKLRKERYKKKTIYEKQANMLIKSISNIFNQKSSRPNYCWKTTFQTKCTIQATLKRYNLGELKLIKEVQTSVHRLTRKPSSIYFACFKHLKKLRCISIISKKIDKEIPGFLKGSIFKKFLIGLFELKFSKQFKKRYKTKKL